MAVRFSPDTQIDIDNPFVYNNLPVNATLAHGLLTVLVLISKQHLAPCISEGIYGGEA